jgi:hypothetical protein
MTDYVKTKGLNKNGRVMMCICIEEEDSTLGSAIYMRIWVFVAFWMGDLSLMYWQIALMKVWFTKARKKNAISYRMR